MVISFLGFSRKSHLSESERDDWSVGSIMGDDEVKRTHHSKNQKPAFRLRLPVRLHREDDRTVDSVGDWHSIPEDDNAVCQYRPVITELPLPLSIPRDDDRTVDGVCDVRYDDDSICDSCDSCDDGMPCTQHHNNKSKAVCRPVTTGPLRRRQRALTEPQLRKIARQVVDDEHWQHKMHEQFLRCQQLSPEMEMIGVQQFLLGREWIPPPSLQLKGKKRKEILNSEQFHEALFRVLVDRRLAREEKLRWNKNY